MAVHHRLRVTVRLDPDLRWARVEIRGCLTEENCPALVAVVERSLRILRVPMIVIDAGSAQHVEREGVDALNDSGIPTAPARHPRTNGRTGACSLIVPAVLPTCPAHTARPHTSRPHGSHRVAA